MAIGLFAVAWFGAIPLREAAVERSYRASWFPNLVARAAEDAGERPLVVLLGSSQTRRAYDPATMAEVLGDDVFITNAGMDAIHPCAYPYFVRRLLDDHDVALLVVEIGGVSHDQYQGLRFLRRYIEDAAVREALEENPVARRYLEPTRHGDRVPLSDIGRQWRNAFDAERRLPKLLEGVEERAKTAGWTAVPKRMTFENVVELMAESYALQPDEVEDAYLHRGILVSMRIVEEICRERGVPLVIQVPPINRTFAPHIGFLRHFEAALSDSILPALRASDTPVLVPPDRFFAADLYTDHFHIHADSAPQLSRWLAEELAPLR